jgi:hypothetical protein
MREHRDVGIADRADDALGHFGFGEVERRVHRRDDVVQLGEHFIGEIERAVAQDIAFDTGEDAQTAFARPTAVETVTLFVQLPDGRALRAEARFVEPVRDNGAAAVIGDAEILQAELFRGGGHLFERIAPVARGGVTMKRAAQIFLLDQARQSTFRRRFEFAAVFTQLRLDVVEAEGAIQLRLIVDLGIGSAALRFFFAAGSGGAGASRYSFSVHPRCSARFRTTTLCSLLPVK